MLVRYIVRRPERDLCNLNRPAGMERMLLMASDHLIALGDHLGKWGHFGSQLHRVRNWPRLAECGEWNYEGNVGRGKPACLL